MIKEMVLREGMKNLLSSLTPFSVPVLILSAGLTESIRSVLKDEDLLSDNIEIASNCLKFNEAGVCTGIAGDRIIHPLNKDEWDAPESVQKTFE